MRKGSHIFFSVSKIIRHVVSALMREVKVRRLLGCNHSGLDGVHAVEPRLWFQTVSYSKNLHNIFGKSSIISVSKDYSRGPTAVTLNAFCAPFTLDKKPTNTCSRLAFFLNRKGFTLH